MTTINQLDWEVLNATADDWESLETVYHQLGGSAASNGVGRSLSLAEIAEAIHRLCLQGQLTARRESGDFVRDYSDLGYVWRSWFSMTSEGRSTWSNLAPPARASV